jgi:hypothetical protein
MNRSLLVPALLAVVVAGVGAWWLARTPGSGGEAGGGGDARSAAQAAPAPQAAGGTTYTDPQLRFSFAVPPGYRAHALGADANGTESVIVESDASSAGGLQISIAPFDEDLAVLTAARIMRDVPGIEIADATDVRIAPGITGLEFASDNPAYDGASEELWFVYRGALYQLSTYRSSAALLATIWSTWKWR